MKETAAAAYRKRFSRVVGHINANACENLTLDELCRLANFSKFHFHRQFSEYFGVSVFTYIQMVRLKRAAYQLAYRKQWRIIEIALAAGFESPESFSRAFKNVFGQTPTKFRNRPEWNPWHRHYQRLVWERVHDMKRENNTQVEVIDFKETKVAALEHYGSPDRIMDSVQKFIEWRKENKVSPAVSETYNIVYNDPETVPPGDYRMDICASVKSDVKENLYGVVTKVIPAGRCARIRHTGSDEDIRGTFNRLYAEWLPESGEELRDFPVFFHRVTLFPDVAEHEMITDIYLPLK